VVAFGLLIEGDEERLAVAADQFPYKLEVTTDETRIAVLSTESELVSVARYIRQFSP
jgi:hypothetical protein